MDGNLDVGIQHFARLDDARLLKGAQAGLTLLSGMLRSGQNDAKGNRTQSQIPNPRSANPWQVNLLTCNG